MCSQDTGRRGVFRSKRSNFGHLDRMPQQVQDGTNKIGNSYQAKTLHHENILETIINQKKQSRESVGLLPEMLATTYRASNTPRSKKQVYFVNAVKDTAADQLNNLRTKREERSVEVDVIIHAGANLKINAGSIMYLIPETTTTQSTPSSTNSSTSDDSNLIVTTYCECLWSFVVHYNCCCPW